MDKIYSNGLKTEKTQIRNLLQGQLQSMTHIKEKIWYTHVLCIFVPFNCYSFHSMHNLTLCTISFRANLDKVSYVLTACRGFDLVGGSFLSAELWSLALWETNFAFLFQSQFEEERKAPGEVRAAKMWRDLTVQLWPGVAGTHNGLKATR